ncbi:MAG TPA: hypothetical protein VH518_03355 [Tepidisphaeraceae bacterium]|jgi:hypothetical protein
MNRTRSLHLAATAALGLFSLTPSHAAAQVSGTWIHDDSGTWTVTGNWSSDPQFPDGGGVASFSPGIWNTTNVTLTSGISLSSIHIDSATRYAIGGGGSITFAGPALIDVSGPSGSAPSIATSHAILSRIITSSGIIKSGSGAVLMDLFDFSGGLTVNAGTVATNANTPFGPNPGKLTLNGGAMRMSLPVVSQPIVIGAGGGIFDGFAILNGAISGSGLLTFKGVGNSSFSLGGASDFSGALIGNTPLTVSGIGVLPIVSSYTFSSSIKLDNSGSVTTNNRINDFAPITLIGGAITAPGNASLSVTETIGSVTLQRGLCAIAADTNSKITTPQILRSNRATLNAGSMAGSLKILNPPALAGLGAAGTPQVGIIPWIRQETATDATPVTLLGDGSLRALSAAEFINAVPSGSVTASNLKLTADDSVTSAATVNSLTISPAVSTLTLGGPATLSISSGAVFLKPPPAGALNRTTISAPIDFGTAEGIIHTPWLSNGSVEFTGGISGSNGLTLAGGAILRGASTYTGTTTIQGILYLYDDVSSGVPGPLGTDTSPVLIDGGTQPSGITFNAFDGASITFGRNIVINQSNNGSVALMQWSPASGAPAGDVFVTGNIQLNGSMSLKGGINTPGQGFVVSGKISGPGRILAPSNVTISGENDFTGGVELGSAGSIRIGSDTALGSGPFWIAALAGSSAPTVEAVGGPRTLANNVVVETGVRFLGSQPLTFLGDLDLFGTRSTIDVSSTAPVRVAGLLYDGFLSKNGTGVLEVGRTRVSSIITNTNGGTIRLVPNGSPAATSGTRALSLTNGTQLDLTNNDMFVDYTGPTIVPSLRTMLHDGRLTSSLAAATHGIGYGDNAVLGRSQFNGIPIDSSTAFLKYTYLGDADLDGDADGVDIGTWAVNFTGEMGGTGSMLWTQGDWDYDGDVDGVDAGLWAAAFTGELGGGGLGDLVVNDPNIAAGAAAILRGMGITVIPEPTVVGVLVLATFCSCRRRKHF